jgi:hypothetical protein
VPPLTAAAPAEWRHLFPQELAELTRLGKSGERCHAAQAVGCRVLCLPFFNFDGFNALLALEQEGRVVAAWQDSEAFQEASPRMVHACVAYAAVEGLLLGALRGE